MFRALDGNNLSYEEFANLYKKKYGPVARRKLWTRYDTPDTLHKSKQEGFSMKSALLTTIAIAALAPIEVFAQSAPTPDPDMTAKILKGFQIAPVPLNMVGKDPALVGYGSFLVNAVGDCNGCHTADPSVQYSPGGNPYFSQPTKVNPATYLGGGSDFGAFPDPNGPFPHIVSRNLTPDSTGMAEGGNTFQQFLVIIRSGIDMDHVHPTCKGAPDGKCLPAPFNGDLLQIMPWPTFAN